VRSASWPRPSRIPAGNERWLSPLTGLANGLITGFTGSAILPAVLYFQALGLDKERLVQGMGLLFCVSTAVLMVAFTQHELLTAELALLSTLALVPALLGLWLGAASAGGSPRSAFAGSCSWR
jgi:uncharacterized protein